MDSSIPGLTFLNEDFDIAFDQLDKAISAPSIMVSPSIISQDPTVKTIRFEESPILQNDSLFQQNTIRLTTPIGSITELLHRLYDSKSDSPSLNSSTTYNNTDKSMYSPKFQTLTNTDIQLRMLSEVEKKCHC